MKISNLERKRRLRVVLIIVFVLEMLLMTRIGYIQFIMGTELQAMAYEQQTLNRNVNPKRGTIWDASGKIALAVSASTETVSIAPTNISSENKEKVAKALADIFELDYEKVLKKVKRRSSIEIVAKKVEKEKTDELKKLSRFRNGIETVPAVLRRRHHVDKIPVRGYIKTKLFFGFKIAGMNARKLIRYLTSQVNVVVYPQTI